MPADAHPHDEIRAHPRIRRVHFSAATGPADLDIHGLEHVSGFGLGMFDHLGG
jgi:hypothetical protein